MNPFEIIAIILPLIQKYGPQVATIATFIKNQDWAGLLAWFEAQVATPSAPAAKTFSGGPTAAELAPIIAALKAHCGKP